MKHALLAVTLALTGCVSDHWVSTSRPHGAPTIFHADSSIAYLVDPTSETCSLVYGSALVAIDCATLARNLPDAARAITWTAPPTPPTPPT